MADKLVVSVIVAVIPGPSIDTRFHSFEYLRKKILDGNVHDVIVYIKNDYDKSKKQFAPGENQFNEILAYLKEIDQTSSVEWYDPSELKEI